MRCICIPFNKIIPISRPQNPKKWKNAKRISVRIAFLFNSRCRTVFLPGGNSLWYTDKRKTH